MCCLVQAGEQRIVIDPGVALGYMRHGLLPHPAQVAIGIAVRQAIIEELATATDVVFSHFHGDHVPLREANPYQLSLQHMAALPEDIHCWSASWQNQSPKMHGLPQGRTGTVMMTRVRADGQVFVHGSDIQLLGDQAVDTILQWQPDTVFISGPPLYRQSLSAAVLQQAWENGIRLAENVETLIIDHHLLRSEQGLKWLDEISQAAGKNIYCAADFMHRPRLMLEARRTELYQKMEVPENWHRKYEQGKVSVDEFVIKHEIFS